MKDAYVRSRLECSINRVQMLVIFAFRLPSGSLLRSRWRERSAIPTEEACNKDVNDEPSSWRRASPRFYEYACYGNKKHKGILLASQFYKKLLYKMFFQKHYFYAINKKKPLAIKGKNLFANWKNNFRKVCR